MLQCLRAIFVVASLGLACSRAQPRNPATAESKQKRVLFIGNSYTFVHQLPSIVCEFALARGHAFDWDWIVRGGLTLEGHSTGVKQSDATIRIQDGTWTDVVLQEQSLRPLNDFALFKQFAIALNEEIDRCGASTLLFETWSKKDDIDAQSKLTSAYSSVVSTSSARIVPVGQAWLRVRRQRPDIDLYESDGSHPSEAGSYLAACVFYAALFGENPTGLPASVVALVPPGSRDVYEGFPVDEDIELAPSVALYLQGVAWETVQPSRSD